MGEREVYKELTTFSQIRNRECNECLREISAIYFQEEKKWGGKFRQLLKCCDSITAPTLTFSERNKKLLGKKLLPQKIVR